MAAINWDAAITALNSGSLPCSGSERRVLPMSASLANGIPSTSATPSPDSTTTPHSSSPSSATQPENDREQQASIAALLLLNSRDSTQCQRENSDESFPDIRVSIKPIQRFESCKVKVDCRQPSGGCAIYSREKEQTTV